MTAFRFRLLQLLRLLSSRLRRPTETKIRRQNFVGHPTAELLSSVRARMGQIRTADGLVGRTLALPNAHGTANAKGRGRKLGKLANERRGNANAAKKEEKRRKRWVN